MNMRTDSQVDESSPKMQYNLPWGSSKQIQQSFVYRLVQWLGCLESHETLTSESAGFLTPAKTT